MVKPSGFVDGLCKILDLSPQLVSGTYRALREAGLIDTGPRGVNARSSTCRDAARMAISLLVTDRPSQAVAAVADFGQLVGITAHPIGDTVNPDGEAFRLEATGLRVDEHTFEDAVTEVIRRYGEDRRKPYWRESCVDLGDGRFIQPFTRLDVYVDGVCAVITANGMKYTYADPIIRTFPRALPDTLTARTAEDERYAAWLARSERWRTKISTIRKIDHELIAPLGSLICEKQFEVSAPRNELNPASILSAGG